MSAKKRQYLDEYIRFELVSLKKGDTEILQCVMCNKTFSNDGLQPSRLERHLGAIRPTVADKPRVLFATKRYSLKQVTLDSSGALRQQTTMVVEAFYEIAVMIAKSKNIGVSLIKPDLPCAAKPVLKKDSTNKLS